jgi:hypothetical protein
MNKKFFTTLFVMIMVLSMMLMCVGCGDKNAAAADESAARIAQLEQENASLKAQVEELTAQLDRVSHKASLQDWSMSAKAWSDGNGATVTFIASPVNYVEGQKAALSIRMGELEAESTNCVWDGTAYTGSVELSAADGYSYYCVLTNADGSQSEVALNSPENVVDDTLVNLGSSLSAYASLVVEDWEATASSLTIKSGYVQAQMPRLTFNDMSADVSGAELILKLNSEEIARQSITLTAGEGNGSFESTLDGNTFTMPLLEDDYQLDLWLEVSLNTGVTVSVSGGSWYNSDGQLQLVVG